MSHSLRVVLAGCGGISGAWFNGVKDFPDVSIVGLVDLHEDAARKRREEYQLAEARTGSDLKAMLSDLRPDIVFDCTVPAARATVVQAALQHGCHVLSEKPMANSMEEARALIETSRKAGKIFAVMQNRRHDPRIRALRALLDSGKIGALTTLNGDFFIGAHFGGFRDQMEHVLLLDMAIHTFDQARLISGADPVSVFCHEWNPQGSWYAHGASAVAIFEMTHGIVFTYRGSWCAEGVQTTWESDWRALATQGSVTWDGGDNFRAQKVDGHEGFRRPLTDVPVIVPPSTDATLHAGCIRDFIRCVQIDREPETICTDNIKSLAMVFGAIESAKTGKKVDLSQHGA